MMSLEKQSWKYHDSQVLNSQMLELSYFGKDLSLILVLPKKQNGLEKLKTVLTSENLFPEIKKTSRGLRRHSFTKIFNRKEL
jgi:serine protease inhibitor